MFVDIESEKEGECLLFLIGKVKKSPKRASISVTSFT